MMKAFGFLALSAAAVFACAAASAAETLDSLVGANGEMFAVKAGSFLSGGKNRLLFKWLSDKQDEAHYPGWGNSPALTLFGFTVEDANLRFKDGLLSSVYASVYNRGDAGDIDQDKFNKQVGELDAKIGEWTADKGTLLKKTKLASDANTQSKVWVKEPYVVTMKWSSTGRSKKDFKAEYVQVEIAKFDPKDDPRKQTSANARDSMQSAKSILENVKKESNGDVFIDNVPMVDQGQKGYCVVASAERVLKYYGAEVSQHDLAQIASSSAEKGTSLEDMVDAAKKVGVKLGFKLREHYKGMESVRDIEKAVSKYNSYAKKMKKREISTVCRGNVIYIEDTMNQMEDDVFKKMKCEGGKTDCKNFLKDIKEHVDKGIPLLWSVSLGKVKEEKITPQMRGGHMRLIIGYNEKDKMIVYSDSWGAEHAFKKMSYDDAWTITTALLSFDPRK